MAERGPFLRALSLSLSLFLFLFRFVGNLSRLRRERRRRRNRREGGTNVARCVIRALTVSLFEGYSRR